MIQKISSHNIAVFSCKGLGDGLISLILSHNLQLQGHEVVTYHPFLRQLQEYFPHLPIRVLPEDPKEILFKMDRIFFFFENLEPLRELIAYSLKAYPEKTTVLNPIATKKQDYPFWSFGKFDGSKSFVDNLVKFCGEELRIEQPQKSNGISPPSHLKKSQYKKRIALHPTSSREGKNWPKEKFLVLADHLKARGFDPYFILSPEEKKEWQGCKIALAHSLKEIADFIYESGYLIGNDSGMGHLASCLGIPTLTIARSPQSMQFWKPAFERGLVLTPPSWVPNFKMLRLRDKYWKQWIGVKSVEKAFDFLVSEK